MTVTSYIFSGHIVEEEVEFSLSELSQACGVNAEWLITLVEEGILDPHENGSHKNRHQWRFSGPCIQRVRIVRRLQQDLGINLAGVALTLELLGEINDLKARLIALESGTAEEL